MTQTVNAINETWEQKRERENKEKAIECKNALKVMREVSRALGYTILEEAGKGRYKEHQNSAFMYLKGPNGELVDLSSMRYGLKPGTLAVGVSFPKDKRGQDTRGYVVGYGKVSPSINVSMNKGAERIAKEIVNRLLPEYIPMLAKAHEIVESLDAYQDRRNSAFSVLFDREPNTEHEKNGDEMSVNVGYFNEAQEYTSSIGVRISGGEVKLSVDSLTPKLAREVIDFLKSKTVKKQD